MKRKAQQTSGIPSIRTQNTGVGRIRSLVAGLLHSPAHGLLHSPAHGLLHGPAHGLMNNPDREQLPSPAGGARKTPFFSRRFQQNMLMFLLMFLFGIILMNHIVSVRSRQTNNSLLTRYRQRQEDLALYEKRYQALLAENEELNRKKAAAIEVRLAREGQEDLLAELEKIRILAGFTELRGKGITLTLNDKPGYDMQIDSDDSIVHDGDIRHALDLLRDAGAAAFSINGLRFTNSSSIFCIGSTIRCNQERVTPPYVIRALGNPAPMSEAIRSDQVFNIRQSPGIGLIVKFQEEKEVVIPPFAEADNIGQFIDLLEVVKP